MFSIIYTVELYYTQLQAEMPAADGTKWRWAVQVSLTKKNKTINQTQYNNSKMFSWKSCDLYIHHTMK